MAEKVEVFNFMGKNSISIALFGRNDDYENNYIEKLRLSIYFLRKTLKKFDYEIVLLDYNPVPNKKLLSEIFPSKKYPYIKHVVFSNKDHLKFIKCHLKAGAKLKYKRNYINFKNIYNIEFIGTLAANLSVKYSSGDYVLSTGTDNIFNDQFIELFNSLEPDILYRCCICKINSINFKRIKQFFVDNYYNIDNEDFKNRYNFPFKIKNTIWNSCGNFLLMDKKSWEEVGGYWPLLHPKPLMGDARVIYNSVIYNKKIKYVNKMFFNIDNKKRLNQKNAAYMNYVINFNDFNFDYLREKKHKRWEEFRKLSKIHLLQDQEFLWDFSDQKNRIENIKNFFSSIIPNKYLLQRI